MCVSCGISTFEALALSFLLYFCLYVGLVWSGIVSHSWLMKCKQFYVFFFCVLMSLMNCSCRFCVKEGKKKYGHVLDQTEKRIENEVEEQIDEEVFYVQCSEQQRANNHTKSRLESFKPNKKLMSQQSLCRRK